MCDSEFSVAKEALATIFCSHKIKLLSSYLLEITFLDYANVLL